jgi:ABC-2 type transport system ATP-binding protein
MEEAERLCDRLVIIDHGKVVADDTLQGLHKLMPAATVLTVELSGSQEDFYLVDELRALPGVQSAEMRGGSLKIGLRDLSTDAPRALEWLVARGHSFQRVSRELASLESVFLTLTGSSLRD